MENEYPGMWLPAAPDVCECLACLMNTSLHSSRHSAECMFSHRGFSELQMWHLVTDDYPVETSNASISLTPNEEWRAGYTITLKMPEHLYCDCTRSRGITLFRQHLQEYGIFPVNDLILRLWARRLLRECPGLCMVNNVDSADHVVLCHTSLYPHTPLLDRFFLTAFDRFFLTAFDQA